MDHLDQLSSTVNENVNANVIESCHKKSIFDEHNNIYKFKKNNSKSEKPRYYHSEPYLKPLENPRKANKNFRRTFKRSTCKISIFLTLLNTY